MPSSTGCVRACRRFRIESVRFGARARRLDSMLADLPWRIVIGTLLAALPLALLALLAGGWSCVDGWHRRAGAGRAGGLSGRLGRRHFRAAIIVPACSMFFLSTSAPGSPNRRASDDRVSLCSVRAGQLARSSGWCNGSKPRAPKTGNPPSPPGRPRRRSPCSKQPPRHSNAPLIQRESRSTMRSCIRSWGSIARMPAR